MVVVIFHKIPSGSIACFGEMNAPSIIGLPFEAFRFGQYGKADTGEFFMRAYDEFRKLFYSAELWSIFIRVSYFRRAALFKGCHYRFKRSFVPRVDVIFDVFFDAFHAPKKRDRQQKKVQLVEDFQKGAAIIIELTNNLLPVIFQRPFHRQSRRLTPDVRLSLG